MQNDRVLGYNLAKELTHEDMREVAGGNGNLKNRTTCTTNEYTHPIGIDVTIDADLALDT
ncbi:Uncharacterised protein [Legionella lansingensis]|uniref:Uncharacterized protein n=1 Tax=Legionella lansingensis TaxID=45067 RepID=A0A0W0VZ12_9GAMM|nr:hypothetical protein [Legionella lansingensis]KTD25397.1 hypothetical protein Llan_0143 [Legionella lansingensis]SNV51354.1 Uncharacterised protein [Legionella lansingensis]